MSQTFAAWLTAYKHAWESGDPDAVVQLFTSNATYEETPFSEPMRGREAIRDYWRKGAQEAQRDVHFTYKVLALNGNVGICHWRCTLVRVADSEVIELDGIFHCNFDPSGLCTRFQEWWHRKAG